MQNQPPQSEQNYNRDYRDGYCEGGDNAVDAIVKALREAERQFQLPHPIIQKLHEICEEYWKLRDGKLDEWRQNGQGEAPPMQQ